MTDREGPRGAPETRLRMPDAPASETTPTVRTTPEASRGAAAETRIRRPAAPDPRPAESAIQEAAPSPTQPPGFHIDSPQTASSWVDPDPVPQGSPGYSDVTVGSLLGGRYRLERRLGEGGMGVVYLASDQEVQGETFAVKVLKPEIRDQPEALALLREEVRRTRALPHPNIVGVYSLNADNSNVYMLMEYLEGKSLDALIDEDFGRGMPFERAWPLIQDIGAALAFAHDHSVIHSDLKPSNVFVTTGGKAKIVDFGIARAARGRRRGAVDPAALGALTPEYASCEMLEGLEPDMRDDVYQLACVFYEMLSGKHPFGGRTAVEARDEKRVPAPLPALSRSQNEALAGALAFERELRTASVEVLVAGLSPKSNPTFYWKPVVLIGGILLIAALVGGGWWLWTHSESPSVASPIAGPETVPIANVSLANPRTLAEEARKLDVDPADPSLVRGMERLRAAEQEVAAGRAAQGAQAVADAEVALQTAIRSGGRNAHVGSEGAEVALAVGLCKRSGGHCSADDFADEAPRTVVLRPFALDTTGTTNAQFAQFVQAKGVTTTAEQGMGLFSVSGNKLVPHPGESWKTLRAQDGAGADAPDFPVRGIDFESAKAYCTWAGKRLPTEEEWEFVARPDRRIFPWGNDPMSPEATAPQRLLAVTQQSATGRFGARGLGGTLWEWVDGGTGSDRVFRGASWLDTDIVHRRLATRGLESPTRAHVDTGFRCAKSLESWPSESAR